MNAKKKKNGLYTSYLMGLVGLFFISLPTLANSPRVGTVKCNLIGGTTPVSKRPSIRTMSEATLSATSRGFDLNFTDELGNYVLRLNNKLLIEEALTLGNNESSAWNLVGYYQKPTPVSINSDGLFSISMLVSTRSICTFKGELTFSPGTKEKLFGN